MRIISHRGNLEGPCPESENDPSQILKCLELGIDVEVDVWCIGSLFYFSHDNPEDPKTKSYCVSIMPGASPLIMLNGGVWCHAKNLEAARELKRLKAPHYFWHQNDDFTLTNDGYFWTYPGKQLTDFSIAVLPEIAVDELSFPCAYGVCTDYPLRYIVK